jgi:hypothetical protein
MASVRAVNIPVLELRHNITSTTNRMMEESRKAISCVGWYILGYMKYQTLDNWIGGIWPAIFGSMVSLILFVLVSKRTPPPPQEVQDIFFGDES